MKTTRPYFTKLTLAALALLTVGALTVLAQPDPDARPQRRQNQPGENQPQRDRQFQPQGNGQFRPQAGVAGGVAMMSVMRVLTEEQRESMREVMQSQREKMQPIEEQLREARKEILTAGLGEKFNEDAVREKALKVAKLEAELTVLRAKALSQIKPALSPEQIAQIKNPPPMETGQGRAQGRPEFRGDNPDQPRGQFRRDNNNEDRPRGQRPPAGRDENDLPPKPKPDV